MVDPHGRSVAWKDLGNGQRAAMLTLISVELALTATALVDLRRRPRARVAGGRKAPWAALCFVQPVGPVTYLLVHRRR